MQYLTIVDAADTVYARCVPWCTHGVVWSSSLPRLHYLELDCPKEPGLAAKCAVHMQLILTFGPHSRQTWSAGPQDAVTAAADAA